jgi:hypothetical protein
MDLQAAETVPEGGNVDSKGNCTCRNECLISFKINVNFLK